jgi:hypothetical protein
MEGDLVALAELLAAGFGTASFWVKSITPVAFATVRVPERHHPGFFDQSPTCYEA